MIALTDASTITLSVVGFFAFLLIVVLIRAVLRRDEPAGWRRYRLGFFIERDPREEGDHDPPGSV